MREWLILAEVLLCGRHRYCLTHIPAAFQLLHHEGCQIGPPDLVRLLAALRAPHPGNAGLLAGGQHRRPALSTSRPRRNVRMSRCSLKKPAFLTLSPAPTTEIFSNRRTPLRRIASTILCAALVSIVVTFHGVLPPSASITASCPATATSTAVASSTSPATTLTFAFLYCAAPR